MGPLFPGGLFQTTVNLEVTRCRPRGGSRSNFIFFGQRPIGPCAGRRERISDVSFESAGVTEGREGDDANGCKAALSTGVAGGGDAGNSRRDVMRKGVRLAFITPVLVTFFAGDARAAGSNHSCYPEGHVCNTGSDQEPCCPGLSCTAEPGTCQP
jgi:hypothetical protein